MDRLTLDQGPLHRIGVRTGLVRSGGNSWRLGLAIGVVLWATLLLLSRIEGESFISPAGLAAQGRVLVAIPLFFVAETIAIPRMAAFIQSLQRQQLVPENGMAAFHRAIARRNHMAASPVPDAVCLLLAILSVVVGPMLPVSGSLAAQNRELAASAGSLGGWWYWFVCLGAFRFLFLRWAWRLSAWVLLLYRISRLPLQLIPGHPDKCGGLGLLPVTHEYFAPLVFTSSFIIATSLAIELHVGHLALQQAAPQIMLLLLLHGLLFIAPLFLFTRHLLRARVQGLERYGELAQRYVRAFDNRWFDGDRARSDELLGSADVQSFADMAGTMSVVDEMRVAPFGTRLVLLLALAGLAPFVPLLLFQYPFDVLARQLVERLIGL